MILRGGRKGVKSASIRGRVGRSVRDQSGERFEEPGLSLPNQQESWLPGAKLVKGTPLSTMLLKQTVRQDGAVTGVAEHALHEQARVVSATTEAAAVLEGAGAQYPVTACALKGTVDQDGRGMRGRGRGEAGLRNKVR